MRSALLLFLCAGAFAASPAKILQTAPIQFEQTSQGQWSARGLGYAFRFEKTGTAMRLGDRTLRMTFENSNASAPFSGLDHSARPTNSFHGKNYQRIENFARLRRTGIYPGIDLLYYSRNGELEYDFEIAPGADPSKIALRFEGADDARLNDRGDLVLTLAGKELTHRAPSIYQRRASGEMVTVDGSYRIGKDGVVRFHLGDYDRSAALVIDPAVFYVAFLGGSSGDMGVSVGHDQLGYIYVGGSTYSTDFPLGGVGFSTAQFGELDCFLLKLNPYTTDGTQVITYSSYYGGSSNDMMASMKVDSAGIMYFTGSTNSTDFPTTSGAYSTTLTSLTHAFMAEIDSNQDGTQGQLYSTYFGGTTANESGEGIFPLNGLIYIAGTTASTDLPLVGASQGALAGSTDAFVARFDPTQQGTASLTFSSYLGGGARDLGNDIAVDSKGLIYVTGSTFSGDFPYTASTAYQTYAGEGDAFLAVIDPSASAVVYATSFGGPSGYDEAKKLLVDPNGKRVAIAGYTMAPDLPITQNAYQSVMPAGSNVDSSGNLLGSNGFLAIFDLTAPTPGKGLVYSTYLGGFAGEVIYDLKRDAQGRYYMCGYTLSRNFPVTGSAFNTASAGGGLDGFVTVLDPTATVPANLVYSSYVTSPGTQTAFGLDVDNNGTVWITGVATGNIFPPTYEQFPPSPSTGLPQYGKMDSFIWGFTIK
jgi:hypothetical protein